MGSLTPFTGGAKSVKHGITDFWCSNPQMLAQMKARIAAGNPTCALPSEFTPPAPNKPTK